VAFQNTIITTTAPTTIISPVTGYFNDLIWVILTNTSSTGVRVDITAGGPTCSIWLPATTTLPIFPPSAIPVGSTGNTWTAALSAAVTDVRIFANYLSHQ